MSGAELRYRLLRAVALATLAAISFWMFSGGVDRLAAELHSHLVTDIDVHEGGAR